MVSWKETYCIFDFPHWRVALDFEYIYWLFWWRDVPHFNGVIRSTTDQLVLFNRTEVQCKDLTWMSIDVLFGTGRFPYIPYLNQTIMWCSQTETRNPLPTYLFLKVKNQFLRFFEYFHWVKIFENSIRRSTFSARFVCLILQ